MSQHQGCAPDYRENADLQPDNEQQRFRNVHRARHEVNGESILRKASKFCGMSPSSAGSSDPICRAFQPERSEKLLSFLAGETTSTAARGTGRHVHGVGRPARFWFGFVAPFFTFHSTIT